MNRTPLLFGAALALLAIALPLSPPSARPSALAQDGAAARSAEEQAKREAALVKSLGSGLALSCYSTLHHIGGMAEEIKAGKDPAKVRVRAAVARRLLDTFKKEVETTAKTLGEARENYQGLIDLVETAHASAEALAAFCEDPSEAKAADFRSKQRKAWELLAETFKWKGEIVQALAPGGFDLEAPAK